MKTKTQGQAIEPEDEWSTNQIKDKSKSQIKKPNKKAENTMNKKNNQQQEKQKNPESSQPTVSQPLIRHVDYWVVLKYVSKQEVVYRLLSATDDGVMERWRLNSGILKITTNAGSIDFHGYSGSVYRCKFDDEGMTPNMVSNLDFWKQSTSRHGDTLDVIAFRSFLQEWATYTPTWN